MEKNDWDINPQNYVTNEDGSFVLKKDGTPRKKAGRSKGSKGRGYNYHSTTKAKQEASKSVRAKKRKIAKARSDISRYQKSVEKTEKALDLLDDNTKKNQGRVVEDTFVEEAAPSLQAELKKNVIFQPNDGPQQISWLQAKQMCYMAERLVEAKVMRCWLTPFDSHIGQHIEH